MYKNWYFRMVLLFGLVMLPLSARADRNVVRLETNYGDIILELYPDDAPVSVANFLRYVNRGFYDGLIFHRVIDQFMIQAGAYDADLYRYLDDNPDPTDPNWPRIPLFYREPNEPIINESDNGLLNLSGTIAMARTSDPDSATSQFFINHDDNPSLDPGAGTAGYAVFGGVIDGFGIVDDIAQVPTTYANSAFEDLPLDPVIIIKAEEIFAFDSNDVDLREVPFLHAADGTVRIFTGQGTYLGSNYTHTFSAETFLNIKCLKWQQTADEDADMEDFTMLLAKDKAGGLWIFKYVINEGEEDEEFVFEAETLFEGVSFSEFAEENIYFRLITGQYNPDILDDPDNTVTVGQGAEATTWKIVSTDAALNTSEEELVLVKKFVGSELDPNNVDWLYYGENYGLVLDLLDDAGDTLGDGFHLAPMNFDGTSDDLSEIPFLHAATEEQLVRTFVGQGAYLGTNYTHTFTPSEEPFAGVDYVVWEQSSIEAAGIDSFTLHLARDVTDSVWVFKYEVNDETRFEAEIIPQARPLGEIDDVLYFRLITGTYNPDDLDDPSNVVTLGNETHKIMNFTASVSHIPHYQGELIRVNKWQGAPEPNDETLYYHESKGLILNLLKGETGADGDGWHLAFFGADFEDDSGDFSDVPFLNAEHSSARSYFGQGAYEGLSYNYEYTARLHITVNCLKWRRTLVAEADLDEFYLYLARDSMDLIWVFSYFINGQEEFKADTIFDAKPLSDFDDVMFFRLISGKYNPNNLNSPQNRFTTEKNGLVTTHRIQSFDGRLDYQPSLNQNLVLEKLTPQVPDPNIGWRYFDESVGLVLDLANTSEDSQDANFYDPNDVIGPPSNLDGWCLGFYGQTQPDFYSDSDDLTDIPFVNADNEDLRLYQGQGEFAGTSYRVTFTTEELFDVECLRIDESAVIEWLRPTRSFLIARDTTDKLWLFRTASNGISVFEAAAINEIAPLDQYPDMYLRLVSGDYEAGTTITTGSDGQQQTEQVIRLDESLASYDEFDDDLVLVQWLLGEDNDDVTWTYFHESVGSVLELWPDSANPNSFDPNIIDTEGAGWLLAEPNQLEDLKISLRASNNRAPASDFFKITGKLPQAQAENFENTELYFSVGPWNMLIDTGNPDEFKQLGSKGLFVYKGSPHGASVTMVIDLRKENKFTITAKKADLSGLHEPIMVALKAGNYYSVGEAKIKGGKKVPIQLFKGQADNLRVSNFRMVFDDGLNAFNSYDLTINGQIATDIYPLDLSGKEVTISWGEKVFTIPAGSSGLVAGKKQSNRERYAYKNPGGVLRSVIFNLQKNIFKIVIRKTNLSRPPQDLTIRFETQAGRFFEQTVLVF